MLTKLFLGKMEQVAKDKKAKPEAPSNAVGTVLQNTGASGEEVTEEYDRYRYEKAREWLDYIRQLGIEVDNAQGMVESERAMLDGVRGIDYTREHVSGTHPTTDLADLVDRLFEHIRDYTASLAAYTDERRKAFEIIDKLPDPKERYVLSQYYLLGKTWNDVRAGLDYSWQGIMTLRKRAILSVFDVLPAGWRDARPPAL